MEKRVASIPVLNEAIRRRLWSENTKRGFHGDTIQIVAVDTTVPAIDAMIRLQAPACIRAAVIPTAAAAIEDAMPRISTRRKSILRVSSAACVLLRAPSTTPDAIATNIQRTRGWW